MILFWIPLPGLLRVQAVNKRWRDLVSGSSTLRQQLFLKPAKVERLWLVEIPDLPSQQRPLRRDYKSALRVLAEVPSNSETLKTFHGLTAMPMQINPLLVCHEPWLEVADSIDKIVDQGYVAEYAAPHNLLQTIGLHSMRNMLLTQPPVTNLCVEALVVGKPNNDAASVSKFRKFHSAKIVEPEGVRMHQVVDAMEKMNALERAESIKFFMNGVVEATERDEWAVRKRTEDWYRAQAGNVSK